MASEIYGGIQAIHFPHAQAWRQWLLEHHATAESIWVIFYRKASGTPSLYYPEAVDEALCFGWIDSKANKRDAVSYYQFFSRRKPKSVWSKVNKAKVERLSTDGKMTPAGLRMVEIAQKNGMWNHLDEVEEAIIPPDLAAAFAVAPLAFAHFQTFPPSAQKGILQWILSAKTPDTRARRIAETVAKAALNERANAWKPKP